MAKTAALAENVVSGKADGVERLSQERCEFFDTGNGILVFCWGRLVYTLPLVPAGPAARARTALRRHSKPDLPEGEQI